MTKSKSPKLYIGDIPNLSILSKWPNGFEAATTLAMKIAKMGIKPHNSTNAYNFETQYQLFYVYPWYRYVVNSSINQWLLCWLCNIQCIHNYMLNHIYVSIKKSGNIFV